MPAKPRAPAPLSPLDVLAFLKDHGVSARPTRYGEGTVVFAQGAKANSVFYLQEGGVKLSVLSSAGKEAVVAMLGPGDFFGEGCLAGQPFRMGTASAVVETIVLRIPKRDMIRMLHEHSEFSDRFIAHMLHAEYPHRRRPGRSAVQFEREAAGAHAAAAGPLRQGGHGPAVLPKLSQETLAEMVGTTRSRVNFFMNKFRKLGFIEYNGGAQDQQLICSASSSTTELVTVTVKSSFSISRMRFIASSLSAAASRAMSRSPFRSRCGTRRSSAATSSRKSSRTERSEANTVLTPAR